MKKRRVEAGILLRCAMEVYQFQLDCENHFLHEHPLGTDEWQISQILQLRKGSCVHKVSSSCMPTVFSSSPASLEELYSRCSAGSFPCPALLSKAVLQGTDRQRLREGRGLPRSASTAEAED